MPGNILSESFEGAGYENAGWYENVGSGSTVDEDSTEVTPPAGGGSQTLKTQKVSPNFDARTSKDLGSNQPITYTTAYIRIAAEGLSSYESAYLIQWVTSTWTTPWRVFLSDIGGSPYLHFNLYNDGAEHWFDYLYAINLNQWYRVDVKYDDVNHLWEWRIDEQVINSGSITGVHYEGGKTFYLGDTYASSTMTAYFDLVNIDSTGYVSFGLTLGLTGNEATGSVGNATPARAQILSGVYSAASVGTVVPSRTVGLTGVLATSAVGTVVPSRTVGLTGVLATSAVGMVIGPRDQASFDLKIKRNKDFELFLCREKNLEVEK